MIFITSHRLPENRKQCEISEIKKLNCASPFKESVFVNCLGWANQWFIFNWHGLTFDMDSFDHDKSSSLSQLIKEKLRNLQKLLKYINGTITCVQCIIII